jgi:uncharacterized membrane protein YbhN (UPF0104 family)
MRAWLRRWWPVAKALLAVAIIGGVGWQFAQVLRSPQLWAQPLQPRPEWLIATAILYLLGLGCSARFWIMLLRRMGQAAPPAPMVRAYFIAHLGKYVPGKAWALILRVTMARAAGVRTGFAALTATYETLTLMASGAVLAVVLFALQAAEHAHMGWKALGLLALAGIPILPGVFNPLVRRLARPFLEPGDPVPSVGIGTLAGGLALTACGWTMLGASLWALLQALPDGPNWSFELWARYTAFVAVAYVSGFLILPAPGGLGVRELILQQLLAPELGPIAVVAVLLLRLVWTAAELVMAAGVYWLPASVDKVSRDREGALG